MEMTLFLTNLFEEETGHKGSFGKQPISNGLRIGRQTEDFRLTFQDARRLFWIHLICRLLLAHKNPHPLRFPRFFGPVEGTKLNE